VTPTIEPHQGLKRRTSSVDLDLGAQVRCRWLVYLRNLRNKLEKKRGNRRKKDIKG